MKKIFLLISLIVITVSCTDDITNLNEDTKNPTTTTPEYLFTNAQKALVDQMVSSSVNLNVYRLFSQYWTETTYTDESLYDITTRTIPDNTFLALYRDVLRDFKEAKTLLNSQAALTPEDIAVLNNKKAIVDIMMVYSYGVLVDTFGDVPYTDALDIEANPTPKYDDAETIYKDLISRLATDATLLTSGSSSFDTADLIYNGDSDKWLKFANSLRLRMAINMDDVDHAYATAQVTAALAGGVISSNADNANLNYLSVQPNTNPLYVDLVASGRNDFVPTNTIIDKMNTLSDPRRASYFTFKGTTSTYVGGVYGAVNPFASFSHINTDITNPEFPGTLLDYSEVEFLLAEAAARNIAVGGTEESHYNAGISASMESWGVDPADQVAYLAQPSVAYATATGTWKQKIGEQSWLALYNRGYEAWTSYRRLDFPALVAPADAETTTVPTRYTYPANEETLNPANNAAASTAIGGDLLTTKLFWDKF